MPTNSRVLANRMVLDNRIVVANSRVLIDRRCWLTKGSWVAAGCWPTATRSQHGAGYSIMLANKNVLAGSWVLTNNMARADS